MAIRKKSSSGTSSREAKPGRSPKVGSASIKRRLGRHHPRLTSIVNDALKEAGLGGITVQAIRFAVPHKMLLTSGCNPECSANETCVLHNEGGETRWVCVKN